jgi:hypothetical protein
MASNVIPFESAQVPAFLKAETGNLAAITVAGGFPVISIKGKVFHLNKDGESILLHKPNAPDEPATAIEVVILDVGPKGRNCARIFYEEAYTPGSTESPDCYSNDGIAPAADAESPQANKCAICPQNIKGSKPTESNPAGRACASAKRLAIATPDALDEPILLRVPGASIVPLGDYLTVLKNRGLPNTFCVVTRVSFDFNQEYPTLTFKPARFVTEAQYKQALEASQSEETKIVIGEAVGASPTVPADGAEADPPAKVAPPVAPARPPKVEKPKAEKPKAEKPKAAAPVVEVAESLDDALDAIDFGFDDE